MLGIVGSFIKKRGRYKLHVNVDVDVEVICFAFGRVLPCGIVLNLGALCTAVVSSSQEGLPVLRPKIYLSNGNNLGV